MFSSSFSCKSRFLPTVSQPHLQDVQFSSATLILPALAYAQNNQGDEGPGIKLGVPNGTYAFRDTGQVTLPGSTTPILIAAAGRITFIPTGTIHGQVIGKTSGVLTASINGQISPITINGSFSVNADGSVFEIEQQTGGPNALLHFTDYPTPDGNTITFVETDPGSILSGIDTR
jgi:hypothetical protein